MIISWLNKCLYRSLAALSLIFSSMTYSADTVGIPSPAASLPVNMAVPEPSSAKSPELKAETVNPGSDCTPVQVPATEMTRAEVYQGMPFQPGEEVRYVLKYGAVRVHVGYGLMRVQPPTKYSTVMPVKGGLVTQENRWHRVFAAEAYTGDWYKLIFAGHDKVQAFSRPWDFAVTKFYISQNEEKPFVRRFHAEKWLDFDHVKCNVHERLMDHKKEQETSSDHALHSGAIDAMGAIYKLRTLPWELNKTERVLVYTSEKNWYLEATPVALETLQTAVGALKAYKLALKTYLGRELQQKGKLFMWIAADHPNHPMIRLEGEVNFGSIYLEIDRFTAGTP